MPQWLNTQQAAKRLGISERQLEKMIERGEFPSAHRSMGNWKISKIDLDRTNTHPKSTFARPSTRRIILYAAIFAILISSAVAAGADDGTIAIIILLSFYLVAQIADKYLLPLVDSEEGLFEDEDDEDDFDDWRQQDTPQWMNLEEAADWLEAPAPLVESLLEEGTFSSAAKRGNRWRVRARDLVQYTRQQANTNWLVRLFHDNESMTLIIVGTIVVLFIIIGIGLPDFFSEWPILFILGGLGLAFYAFFKAVISDEKRTEARRSKTSHQHRRYPSKEIEEEKTWILRILDTDPAMIFFYVILAMLITMVTANAFGLFD